MEEIDPQQNYKHLFSVTPIESTLEELTFSESILKEFVIYASEFSVSKLHESQKISHQLITKKLLQIKQRMNCSLETLLLALQINDSFEFRQLIIQQSIKQEKLIQNSNGNCEKTEPTVDIEQSNESTGSQISQFIERAACSLLYVCHKVVEDSQNKFAANVWSESLGNKIEKKLLLDFQSAIVQALDFNLLRPSIYTFVSFLLSHIKVKNPKAPWMVEYLIELYISYHYKNFTSPSKKRKRIIVALSAVKLTCHFLSKKSWNDEILGIYGISADQIDKVCRKLFSLMLDKQKHSSVHQKYSKIKYLQVAKLKLVNLRLFDSNPELQKKSCSLENTADEGTDSLKNVSYKEQSSSSEERVALEELPPKNMEITVQLNS